MPRVKIKVAAAAALPRVLAARRRVQGRRQLSLRELDRRLERGWLGQRLGYHRARRNAR